MREVLANRAYARLFSAQVIALVGTGLLTVALGLLAFDIAGGDAGVVVGTALTIKMAAYVFVSPIATALTSRLPRKPVLVTADVTRAGVALALPWVSETWQIYVLVFVLQAASATFTPTYQAVIPDVLPDEAQYTRALSLSRLAYDLESVLSPVLAAALLTVMSYHHLFLGTAVGFLASTTLVLATPLPSTRRRPPSPFLDRLTRGTRTFLETAQLRGLLALNLVVATSTAMVIVNTVVLARSDLGRSAHDVALLLAAYGAGSMVVAIGLPRALDRLSDRPVMLAGGVLVPVGLVAAAVVMRAVPDGAQWPVVLALWSFLGAGNSLILTPSARLVRRQSDEESRPAVFAAQFSLSHACFMLTYPAAGALGAAVGLSSTAMVLAVVGACAAIAATLLWRAEGPGGVEGSTPRRATRPSVMADGPG